MLFYIFGLFKEEAVKKCYTLFSGWHPFWRDILQCQGRELSCFVCRWTIQQGTTLWYDEKLNRLYNSVIFTHCVVGSKFHSKH